MNTTDQPVPESTQAALERASRFTVTTMRDEIAEMIADTFGRGVIDADRDLAQQIISYVQLRLG